MAHEGGETVCMEEPWRMRERCTHGDCDDTTVLRRQRRRRHSMTTTYYHYHYFYLYYYYYCYSREGVALALRLSSFWAASCMRPIRAVVRWGGGRVSELHEGVKGEKLCVGSHGRGWRAHARHFQVFPYSDKDNGTCVFPTCRHV